MKKGLIVILVVVLLIVAFAGTFISKYNTLVTLDEEVQMASSQIDNQLQRRNDLIPNLVETVKGYADQEKEIFANVSDARAKLIGATGVQEKADANNELSGSLSRLLAISENYPDLKSNENFIQLSDELAGTENRIAVARQDYNSVANDFNKTVKQFPMNIFAGLFGFEKVAYFEAAEGADQVPTVDFNN
ncbi:LemA family protein [Fusibacter bizertensis]|uniref:LemA family protein n=1 Tax=Fusibacter bizertensis TaxID=1488331 RepID=A0ABT6NCV3_9FIRM|nr:LemA family protein [Fusibacter bizertensis]MDH8678244.1 LemA family protein [Fusibacter bizertensis]